jgi:hypothetical protein
VRSRKPAYSDRAATGSLHSPIHIEIRAADTPSSCAASSIKLAINVHVFAGFFILLENQFGVGDTVQYQAWIERARRGAGAQWMRESTDEQIARLRGFLERSPISTEPGRRA